MAGQQETINMSTEDPKDAPVDTSSVNAGPIGQAELALKLECEEMWREINQLQHELNQKKSAEAVDPESGLTNLSCAKEKILKAQIDILSQTKPLLLPEDPTVQRVLLLDELKRKNRDLEILKMLISAEREELKQEQQREQSTIDELKQIKSIFEEKLNSAVETEDGVSSSSELRDIEKKKSNVSQHYKKLLQQMNVFIQEHFPTPSADVNREWKKKRSSRSSTAEAEDRANFVSLQTILENLVNRCLETPHDPYMTLTSCHWPPHVELLTRCGIAQRHPSRDSAIRLTAFQL